MEVVATHPGTGLPSRRDALILNDRIAMILGRLTFNGPIRIIFDCALVGAAIKIELAMKTNDRDNPERPAVIVMHELFSIGAVAKIASDLESWVKFQAERLARDFWAHEFNEWLQYDGQRLHESHGDEAQ